MNLSFIGMSGVGKSFWAARLAQQGFTRHDCDTAIAEKLGEMIDVAVDEDPVHAVGRWMGMPWTEGFDEREAHYLDLETHVTQAALDAVLARAEGSDTVIDTTGSVIYTSDTLLNQLKPTTRVAYFDVPGGVRDQMVTLYLREPKPVLWRGMYQPKPDESRDDALARCYADLLADRAERYRALADVVLDYHALRAPGCDALRVLEMIGS